MFWKKWIVDIKEKTSDMSRKDAFSYVITYYWPHITGFVLSIALIVLFGGHYLFGNEKPVFTCVMVNQRVDVQRDERIAKTFSEEADLDKKRVVIDSDYNFSYEDFQLQGVNESGYEKFFFQWQNGELDAVMMSESFYQYCKDLGGQFREIEETGNFAPYMDHGTCTAVVLGKDSFTEIVTGKNDEKLLLTFPKTGKHEEASRAFLNYFCNLKDGKIGGMDYEEIFN